LARSGWHFRLWATLTLGALLGACAGAPVRELPPEPAVNSAGSAATSTSPASSTPASPDIPPAVPVTVPPLQGPAATESAAASTTPPPPEPTEDALPQPEEQVPDLFARLRRGLALGNYSQSRIDREADWFANNPEYIERTFTRAAPYLQYIVTEVEARGLPLEIALLPIIESAFEPYAYSRARATGLWQFIPGTGERYGLKQDWWYDGRRDVVEATRAALDYLQYLHDLFNGDWLLAIGAYNCGEGNVAKAVRRNRAAGKRIDFWNLHLPAETRGYVPRLLAMTRLVADPERYGLAITGIPDEPYFKRVETGGQISIEVAAELTGITTEEMYALNPAYHRWATDPAGPHFLLVPIEAADTFTQNLLQLTPDQRMRVERYAVRNGDTVNSIAKQFGTTADHLRDLNGLGSATAIQVGSELRVPSAVSALPPKVAMAAARVDARAGPSRVRAVHVVRRGDTLSSIAKRHGMSVATLARLNGISQSRTIRAGQRLSISARGAAGPGTGTAQTTASDGRKVTYVVRRGDTLSGIARTLRVSITSLRSWNELEHDSLRPGQRLVAFVRRRT
jgi:membrane-bound lytic murein transglycosylase D